MSGERTSLRIAFLWGLLQVGGVDDACHMDAPTWLEPRGHKLIQKKMRHSVEGAAPAAGKRGVDNGAKSCANCTSAPRDMRKPPETPMPRVHHVKVPRPKPAIPVPGLLASSLLAVSADDRKAAMPMVMHVKMQSTVPGLTGLQASAPDEEYQHGAAFSTIVRTKFLLPMLALVTMPCSLLLCLRYKKLEEDKILLRTPNLEPQDQPNMPCGRLNSTNSSIQALFPGEAVSKASNMRELILPSFRNMHLETWSSNVLDVVDSSGRPVLRATINIPHEVHWFERWHWQCRFDGFQNVCRATPVGQVFGSVVREHPIISIQSLMEGDEGPVFARCRTSVNSDGVRSTYIYDRDDELFGLFALDASQRKPRYELVAKSLGLHLCFEGSFDTEVISVTNAEVPIYQRDFRVATTEPCALAPEVVGDTAARSYRVCMSSSVDWRTAVLVLLGLIAIGMERSKAERAS
mmetsp:Transcript_8856/g.22923  ORF Transcript_8856/g.22923 Transcript_8856/m.22923 type:complete len:462 (+) Transcript_8856:114-1499(+)